MKAQRGGPAQPGVLPGNVVTGGCKPQGAVQEEERAGYTGLRPVLGESRSV